MSFFIILAGIVSVVLLIIRAFFSLKLPASKIAWNRDFPVPRDTQPLVDGRRVAVIGGGLSGCVAAHALSRLGARVTLYESADTVGGRAGSQLYQLGKWMVRFDKGVDCVTSDCPALEAAAKSAGLSHVLSGIEDRTMLKNVDGSAEETVGLRFRSIYHLLWNGLVLSFRQRLGLLWLWFSSHLPRRFLDPHDPRSMASPHRHWDDVSAQTLADRVVGPTTRHELLEPLCRSLYQVGTADIPAGHLLAMLSGDQAATRWTVDDKGMGELCEALLVDEEDRKKAEEDARRSAELHDGITQDSGEESKTAATSSSSASSTTPTGPRLFPTIQVVTNTRVSSITLSQFGRVRLTLQPVSGGVASATAAGSSPMSSPPDPFDFVVCAVPAPAASSLIADLPATVVSPSMRQFVSSQRYRPSVHAAFLVSSQDFRGRPTQPTLVPRCCVTEASASRPPATDAGPVAYITMPSGRLTAPTPPGQEMVVVYLTCEASAPVVRFLSGDLSAKLPTAPSLPTASSRVPGWMAAQLDTKAIPMTHGRQAGLKRRQVEAAHYIWKLARKAAGKSLPDAFQDVMGVAAWSEGWADLPVASGRRAEAAQVVLEQAGLRSSVALAGDYLGGGSAEGAARSALWAVGALNGSVLA